MPANAPIFDNIPLQAENRTFNWYTDVARERQEEFVDIQPSIHYTKITIPTDRPVGFVFSCDWHLGAPFMDINLWKSNMNLIANNPNIYAWLGGDPLDYYIWGTGIFEQLGNPTFQHKWGYKAVMMLKESGSLLGATPGDHENWSQKGGMEMFYYKWTSDTKTNFMTGTGVINLGVGSQRYKIAVAHRHPGNSIRSETASARRMYQEKAPHADIAITGHNHVLSADNTFVMTTDEEGNRYQKPVTFIAGGAYKAEDGWLNKMGFGKGHIGNSFVILMPDKKMFTGFRTIEEGMYYFERL